MLTPAKVKDLKSDLEELKCAFTSPRLYISNHFYELRNRVDVESEKFLHKQHQNNKKTTLYDKESVQADVRDHQCSIINVITEFERECLASLSAFDYQLSPDLRQQITPALEEIELSWLSSETMTEEQLQALDGLIYGTLSRIQRSIFRDKCMMFLGSENAFISPYYFTAKNIQSFGILIVIVDQFIGSRALLPSKQVTSYEYEQKVRPYGNDDLKAHFFRKKIAEPLSNPIHYIHLNLDENDECELSFNYIGAIQIHGEDVFNGTQINLSFNHITTLEGLVFQGFTNLERLCLENNKLVKLDTCVFTHLKKLKELNLSHNKLSCLGNKTFRSLSNLKVLDLSGNELNLLEAKTFWGLKSLKKLDLANNKLVALDSSGFQGLFSLKFLYLYKNQLTFIEPGTFQSLMKLETLHLNENKLRQLTADQFSGLARLESLFLHSNSIDEIDAQAFQGLQNIQRILLSDNELALVMPSTFREYKNKFMSVVNENEL